MRLHVLQHVPFEGPAAIAHWAAGRGHALSISHLYAGGALPALEHFDRLAVMGGPMGVGDEADYPWLRAEKALIADAIAAGRSVVGICLGAQLIAEVLDAPVYRHHQQEIGWLPVTLTDAARADPLCADLPAEQYVLHWHGDTFELPEGARQLARSAGCEQQAFVYDERVLGLQFHLESTLDSVAAICSYCADEIDPSHPYTQTVDAMHAGAREHVEQIHHTLAALMDRLPE